VFSADERRFLRLQHIRRLLDTWVRDLNGITGETDLVALTAAKDKHVRRHQREVGTALTERARISRCGFAAYRLAWAPVDEAARGRHLVRDLALVSSMFYGFGRLNDKRDFLVGLVAQPSRRQSRLDQRVRYNLWSGDHKEPGCLPTIAP
jgi:hypothetical protein